MDSGAGRQAAEATSKAQAAEMRVRELEHRVEHLAAACSAMWSLLKSQTGLTDQQLQAKIPSQDANAMVQCPGCGRRVSPRHGKCMYCGTACTDPSAFDSR